MTMQEHPQCREVHDRSLEDDEDRQGREETEGYRGHTDNESFAVF